jgi:hypothetical protein
MTMAMRLVKDLGGRNAGMSTATDVMVLLLMMLLMSVVMVVGAAAVAGGLVLRRRCITGCVAVVAKL